MMMKERRMRTGLMKLTPRHVPLKVFQIKEVGTPEYQRVHMDQGHQRTQNHKGKGDGRTGEVK